jgi:hypothetical protein
MKKLIIICLNVAALILCAVSYAGDAPHQIGVFVLNENISKFKDYVIMETALPIRHMENIEEVEIQPLEGIKSGLIAYGTCTAPGQIVRIKLKYQDSSKNFFENLLKRIKKKFGNPKEYRGDPFHILISWKWSFVDKDGRRISMTLQHNSTDTQEKIGNAIKLTMTSLIDEDRQCYRVKALDQREKLRQRKWKKMKSDETDWSLFVPR